MRDSEVVKNSFIFHNDYQTQLMLMSDEDAGALIKALVQYSCTRERPKLGGVVEMAFSFMAAQMDRESAAYIARCGKNSENGAKGGRPKKQTVSEDSEKNQTVFEKTQKSEWFLEKPKKADKDKEEDNDKDKDSVESKTRASARSHTPPSLDDVKAYCKERGGKVDAERWYDFYASKGWMIGKNKMKDWRAAVRRWESDAQARAPDDVKRFGFEQRKYDDDFYNGLVKGFDLDSISKGFGDD